MPIPCPGAVPPDLLQGSPVRLLCTQKPSPSYHAIQNFFVYLTGIDVCPDIPDRQAHGARHEQQAQNRDTDADRPAVYALGVQSFRFYNMMC